MQKNAALQYPVPKRRSNGSDCNDLILFKKPRRRISRDRSNISFPALSYLTKSDVSELHQDWSAVIKNAPAGTEDSNVHATGADTPLTNDEQIC